MRWFLLTFTLMVLPPSVCLAQFVQVQGDQLVLDGQVVRVKGSNYYPKNHYWQKMWPEWDPPQIQTELDLLQGLGGNTIRVLIPYAHGWTDANGNVNPTYLNQLADLVGWCAERGMRPILTLFDWHAEWAPAGSAQEARDLLYLTTLVNRFRDDARVLLWDVKNEPDNPLYGGWDDVPANYAKIDWLERMTLAIRALDPNHPIGIGMTTYTNNYYGINGKSTHSFVDVILFHNYNAPDTLRQINEQKNWNQTYGPRPILLEEGGWPTNPAYNPDFTEANQLSYYQQVMPVVRDSGISGFVQWVLVDFDPGVNNADDWFGLLRADYSRKPAADVFQNGFAVTPFPVPPPPPLNLRIDLGPADLPDGLTRVHVPFDGETDAYADIAGRSCRRPRSETGDNYIYFDCADGKVFGDIPDLYVEVDYLAGGGGMWILEYDGQSGAYTGTPPVNVPTGAQEWRTATFHLTDALFMNRQNLGADFRLNAFTFGDGNKDDWFAEVRVTVATPTPTPTMTPTMTPTATPAATSTPTAAATATATPGTPSPTPSAVPTASPTPDTTSVSPGTWMAY